jgi:hypothetical protein
VNKKEFEMSIRAVSGHYENGTGLSRLLTAAVVSTRFRSLLLSRPEAAIQAGYNGEAFHLKSEEIDRVLSIQAHSLEDFAGQLTGWNHMPPGGLD